MKNRNIYQQKQKLDNLFELASQKLERSGLVNELINEIRDPLSRHLCVLISGFVEQAIRELFVTYANEKSSPNFARYVEITWNRNQNMKQEDLLQLMGSFNSQWHQTLKDFLAIDGRGDALNSIVNLRNSIAHGGTLSSSLVNVREYYGKIVAIIDYIEDNFTNP